MARTKPLLICLILIALAQEAPPVAAEEDAVATGSNWLKVFYHNATGGLFKSNAEALSKNRDDPDCPDCFFSRLDQLENFRTEDGKFHLKIVYPELGGSNEWIQTSNPVLNSTIEGFQPLKLDYHIDGYGEVWRGLGLCTGSPEAFICDTPIERHWHTPIGCQAYWPSSARRTIPGPRPNANGVTIVELYISNPTSSEVPETGDSVMSKVSSVVLLGNVNVLVVALIVNVILF